jgi:hypothetical protein
LIASEDLENREQQTGCRSLVRRLDDEVLRGEITEFILPPHPVLLRHHDDDVTREDDTAGAIDGPPDQRVLSVQRTVLFRNGMTVGIGEE